MFKDKTKLKKVDITNKTGKHQVVWKKIIGDLSLHRLPPKEIDVKDVKVNLKGNVNNHPVLSWRHPETKQWVHAYTIEFRKKKNADKWKRLDKFDNNTLKEVKEKTKHLLNTSKNDIIKQTSAVINIMANTGLRRGERFYTKQTGNKGTLTLHPDEVSIKGNKISFLFQGKSYAKNKATMKDEELANYLAKLKEKNKGKEFLFDTSTRQVNKYWHKILEMENNGFLLKDMRTKVAENVASKILLGKKIDLKGLSLGEQKKVAKEHFNNAIKKVSETLNNTMGIAKGSYVTPTVVKKWVKRIKLPKQYHKYFVKANENEFLNIIINENESINKF